jgi:hypothetical protein
MIPGQPEGRKSGEGTTVVGAASLAPSALPAIPDHELLRVIGCGSYGEVWLARSALGTLRAVKVVRRSRFDSDRPYEREFAGIQRFEPMSRSHDGFVDILHVGRNDGAGFFYYVMELVDDDLAQVGKGESEKVSRDVQTQVSPAHSLTFSPARYSPRTGHATSGPLRAGENVLRGEHGQRPAGVPFVTPRTRTA